MGICILGMGDCGAKTVSDQSRVTSTINKTLTDMINTTTSTQNIQTINLQNASVKLGNIFIGPKCDNASIGNITQTSNVDQKIKINIDLSSPVNLAGQVAQALNTSVKNDQQQKQGVFTTATTDINNNTSTKDYIENILETRITNKVVQEIKNVLNNAQNGDFSGGDIICNAPGLNIGNIVQQMVVQQVVDIILGSIVGTNAVTEYKNDSQLNVSNTSKQENTGLTGFISALFSGLSKLVGSAGLAIFLLAFAPCILVTICVCACALLGGRGAGNKKPTPVAQPKPGFGGGKRV